MSDYKVTTWFDNEALKEVFGIKIKKDGKWYNAALDGEAIFCDTKADAKAKIMELAALQEKSDERD